MEIIYRRVRRVMVRDDRCETMAFPFLARVADPHLMRSIMTLTNQRKIGRPAPKKPRKRWVRYALCSTLHDSAFAVSRWLQVMTSVLFLTT